MIFPRVEIREVADINPRLESKPADGDTISFVPMAAVSELTVSIERPVDRPYREVAKGFTAFQRGDIIIAKITPCFENGKMAHAVDLPRQVGFGSTEFHVLRPKSKLNGRYLFQLLKRPDVRTEGAGKMKGAAGQRRVPAEFFGSLQIPLPPLAEQKRIAAILDAADALRAKRREAIAQLDALLQSSFLTLFGDPVSNPMGWEVRELGSLAKFLNGDRGKNYPSKTDFVSEGIPFINAGHLDGGKVDFNGMNYITKQKFDQLGGGKTRPGDLIYCLRGSLGKMAIVRHAGESAIASSLVIIRPSEECVLEFLYQFLDSPFGRQEIHRFDNGSSQPNLSAASVKKYSVPLPPLPLQQKFAAIVESIERQKATQRAHLAELDALFAALQHRAFRGEL